MTENSPAAIAASKRKRSEFAGHIVDLRRQLDKLQADILHLDMVLRLNAEDPLDIPTKGQMPVRSAFSGRNEITGRCYDLLRQKGTMTADEVSVRAMREKGLIPRPIANNEPTSRGAFSYRRTISSEPARPRRSALGAE
jgi:hypothetical protein